MYVVYTDSLLGEGGKFPDKQMLMFMHGERVTKPWWYPKSDSNFRGKVYGWIGPLPSPKISDLQKRPTKKFAIGPCSEIQHGVFIHGPFNSIKEVLEEYGDEGDCIASLVVDKEPKVIRKWSDDTDSWEKV